MHPMSSSSFQAYFHAVCHVYGVGGPYTLACDLDYAVRSGIVFG